MVNPEFKKFEFNVSKTEGFYLETDKGRLLDFSGSGMTTGYDFFRELPIYPFSSLVFRNRFTDELTAKLSQLSGFENVAYTNSGTGACDVSLSRYGPPFLALEGAYHGRSYLTFKVSNGTGWNGEGKIGHLRVPASGEEVDDAISYNDSLMKRISGEVTLEGSPLIIEMIQSDGGVVVLEKRFLDYLRGLAAEYGLKLIVDEVYTGFGRSGELFLSLKEKMNPDMICLGKGVAGGLPLGISLYNGKWGLPYGSVLAMTGGNSLSAALCLKVLSFLTKDRLQFVREEGSRIIREIASLKNDRIKSVKGRGFMIGVDLSGKGHDATYAYRVRDSILSKGVVCTLVGENNDVLKITPPPLITEEALIEGKEAIIEVLRNE